MNPIAPVEFAVAIFFLTLGYCNSYDDTLGELFFGWQRSLVDNTVQGIVLAIGYLSLSALFFGLGGITFGNYAHLLAGTVFVSTVLGSVIAYIDRFISGKGLMPVA